MNGVEARQKVFAGADFLADTVKLTLGPNGQNAILEKGLRVTNDGKTIASEIVLEDEIENLGVRLLREATDKTCQQVGDATTTATIIAQSIMREAFKKLPKGDGTFGSAMTSVEVVNKIEEERIEITEKLIAMSTPVTTVEQLIDSATVSVEDRTLGELIGRAQFELGADGIIIAEDSLGRDHEIERVNGISVDNGFGTSLVMNNAEKQVLEVNDVRVILTNHTLQDLKPVSGILEQLVKNGDKNVVIMARGFTNEAIATCMSNINTEGAPNIYPMNAPYENQTEIMKDLAAVLGGKFINSEERNLEPMTLADVGLAGRLVSGRYDAKISGIENEYTRKLIDVRLEEIKNTLAGTVNDFEKNNLQKRIAQLTNGFSIIKVGGASKIEQKYKRDKVDDAVMAVRAAYQEGTVFGAGLAFKKIAETLPDDYILKAAICAPYEQIRSTSPADFVIPDWVRDPTKVMRVALENACSVAGIISTVGIAIASAQPKELDQMLRKVISE